MRRPEPPAAASWWESYRSTLDASSVSSTGKFVLEMDSRYILRHGVLGAGPAGHADWPATRVRRGLVMGSVQSGKTASMLGVSALALDEGLDALVVLAGTRVSLWQQTMHRLRTQLDLPEGAHPDQRRILRPRADSGDGEVPLSRVYSVMGPEVRRALQLRRPMLIVVMKNAHHLRALRDLMHQEVIPALNAAARPFHLMVLDDEADEGSILDARAESGLDPRLDDLKQIPRAIVDLWASRPHDGSSASPHLYVTYVGYTATPQANFLQAGYNPLAPQDFVIALRTPYDRGETEPRTTTYRERAKLRGYYTGGEAFYRSVRDPALTVEASGNPRADIADAVRAFLVAGALRLWRDQGSRLTPSEATSTSFGTRDEASRRSPEPHSMLLHPSGTVSDHFDAAAEVLAWANGGDKAAADAAVAAGERSLPLDQLRQRVLDEDAEWSAWLQRYRGTAGAVRRAFDLQNEPPVPADEQWPELRQLLLDEVLPAAHLSIVNSDPRTDDRPRFEPEQRADGSWEAPADLFTIFVSGNVMSRGLTLEGLTTTLFLRHADEPLADTQMQMQRWFGYRGAYLELCRVFLRRDQLDLFRGYHEADEALKRGIIRSMNSDPDTAPSPQVLQGSRFLATGKLANLRTVPLSPGPWPFIRLVNDRANDPNAHVVADLYAGRDSHEVLVPGRLEPAGRLLNAPLSLLEIAELLEQLRYDAYSPARSGWHAERWASLEAHLGLIVPDEGGGAPAPAPLYRPPGTQGSDEQQHPCPYQIAAYLRLWDACLTRHARGLFPTDDASTPWSMLDLARKQREQPRFHVGIRYGRGSEATRGPLADLAFPVRTMQRQVVHGELVATWGSRNQARDGSYPGDQYFDYHDRRQDAPPPTSGETPWRPAGAPGLLLFHIVERAANTPSVALGLGLPLGGPDQFAALAAS
ncbi:Z1 domain-containing protein [Motilibacter peucedani]|uniref:Z1 domain-containing protein n=1 Tax=Motilibacter peucedani TaxID=598650 RepID=A0A420XRR8_9ACTN|nr:Z1 domain-containing protein [Motilibacter peucedani]